MCRCRTREASFRSLAPLIQSDPFTALNVLRARRSTTDVDCFSGHQTRSVSTWVLLASAYLLFACPWTRGSSRRRRSLGSPAVADCDPF